MTWKKRAIRSRSQRPTINLSARSSPDSFERVTSVARALHPSHEGNIGDVSMISREAARGDIYNEQRRQR
jgi:hypothetical protein